MSNCKSWFKKSQKKESKTDQNSNIGLAPKKAIRHFWSADWHKCGPRPEGIWIEINLTFFNFLEVRMRPSLYSDHLTNFSNILASINSRGLSKFNTLFHALWFLLFLTLLFYYFLFYVKDVLEASLRNFFFVSKIF